jgi:hypothetical protein
MNGIVRPAPRPKAASGRKNRAAVRQSKGSPPRAGGSGSRSRTNSTARTAEAVPPAAVRSMFA